MHYTGVFQGMVTGIRGLCNGLGPALFGITFHIFNVELDKVSLHPVASTNTTSILLHVNAVRVNFIFVIPLVATITFES